MSTTQSFTHLIQS